MTLVGRGRESAALDGILTAARREGQALVVRGEPGVGKSTLLDYARDRATRFTVLEARGLETESELPYAGLSQLLAPIGDEVNALPAPQRRTLRAVLGLAPDDRPGDRIAAYVAVSTLLARAGERRPLLAVVDDGHWLDTGSAEALVFVARRAAQLRLALIVAVRDGIRTPFDAAGLPEMRVDGISPAAAGEMLGLRAGCEVSHGVVAQLHEATSGNPLALMELARLLSPGALAGSEALPAPLPAGPDVEQAFGYRLGQLPHPTQTALLVAAADDSGSLEALTKALSLQGHELSALEPAESESLITVGTAGVEFAHPLLRSVAYHRQPAPARREAHAALAEALYPHREPARRAWQLAAATLEPDEDIARELEAAATEASRRSAPATAALGLEAAARLTPDRETRARRLIEAARCDQITSAVEPGLKALGEAIEATEDPKTRAEAMHLRAQTEGLRSHPGEMGAILIAEAARVEPFDRFRAAAMLVEASIGTTAVGKPREALRLANLALPVAEEAGGELALSARLQVAAGRILCGDAVGGYPLVQQARPLLQEVHLSALGNIGVLIPQMEMFLGHFEEAHALFTELTARVRASGTLTALPFPLIGMAETARVMGDWRSAHEHAAEAVTLASEIGHQPLVACGSIILASLAGNQGRLEEARALIDLAITPARQFGIHSVVTLSGWLHGQVELAFGCYDEAIAALEEAGRSAVDHGMEEPGVAAWRQELAEAYARTDRADDAEEVLETLERQAERTGRRLAHAGAARCRGLLARDDDFKPHFERALEWHTAVPCPFERARTELYFGERLRRSRRRTEAREHLHDALRTFEGLGANPWTDRAGRELRATGERSRRRARDTPDELTPQELQVARLVADGATNKEVAGTLFVSPKTVETHLSHAYSKLGIRSRVELARHLEELAPPSEGVAGQA